jgi:hypothetical protein
MGEPVPNETVSATCAMMAEVDSVSVVCLTIQVSHNKLSLGNCHNKAFGFL